MSPVKRCTALEKSTTDLILFIDTAYILLLFKFFYYPGVYQIGDVQARSWINRGTASE